MTQQIGFFTAIAGGLIAQNSNVGTAGILIGLAGLVASCLRVWLDHRSATKRLELLEGRAAALSREVDELRKEKKPN